MGTHQETEYGGKISFKNPLGIRHDRLSWRHCRLCRFCFRISQLSCRNLESNLRSNGNVLSTYALHQFEGTIRNELHQRSPEIHWTFRTFHDNYQPFSCDLLLCSTHLSITFLCC